MSIWLMENITPRTIDTHLTTVHIRQGTHKGITRDILRNNKLDMEGVDISRRGTLLKCMEVEVEVEVEVDNGGSWKVRGNT